MNVSGNQTTFPKIQNQVFSAENKNKNTRRTQMNTRCIREDLQRRLVLFQTLIDRMSCPVQCSRNLIQFSDSDFCSPDKLPEVSEYEGFLLQSSLLFAQMGITDQQKIAWILFQLLHPSFFQPAFLMYTVFITSDSEILSPRGT